MSPPASAARPPSPVDLDEDDDAPADPDWDEAWEAELARRIADVREGRVQLIPWEETQAKIEALLGLRPSTEGSRR
ncbi:MAG: addiction module protein [Polyangiaceae bacterium]